MKKRILLFSATAGIAILSLTSGKNGAGAEKGYNSTGSETGLGNGLGCGVAVGCHSSNTGITVVLELDSAGVATSHYRGGFNYTIKITGTNTTSTVLPYFGFQLSCIKGTYSATTPVNAGTFATTGLPTHVRYTGAMSGSFVCNMVEHSDPVSATTGTGGTGTTYVESIPWTAPVSGTGAVSFWGALNAAPGGVDTNTVTGAGYNAAHITVNEWPVTSSVSTETFTFGFKAFPNPVTSNLNLAFGNAQPGTYAINVFNITGNSMASETIDVNSVSQTSLNTSNWPAGLYQVVVEKDGNRQVISVVK